jgi:uncharacterized protein
MSTQPRRATSVAEVLFGRTRRSVLALLYGHSDEAFYLRQIARRIGTSVGAVQREVRQLADAGLIGRSAQGNQVLYRANAQSPVFRELKSLIAKTAGARDVIAEALLPLGGRIRAAFVYGSVARQEETSDSDVDLLVVGQASFRELVVRLQPAQKTLGREVNPTVYSANEFRRKVRAGNHFLAGVLEGEKLFVVGDESELARLAK